MSQELQRLLHERAALGRLRWSHGLGLSIGFHCALGLAFFWPRHGSAPPPEPKVTWVSLPGVAPSGPSGGSGPQQEAKREPERLRRVEDVAPKVTERPAGRMPDVVGNTRPSPPIKGTSPDPKSKGKATDFSKGKTVSVNPQIGATGSGDSGGIGAGTPIPGLRPSASNEGGSGLIGGLDQSTFPYAWYLQQIQNKIIGNWSRTSNAQGRVGVYFRILKDGTIEGWKVESPSNNYNFDQSALLAVRRSTPLQPLPDGFESNQLGVHFWFTYLGN